MHNTTQSFADLFSHTLDIRVERRRSASTKRSALLSERPTSRSDHTEVELQQHDDATHEQEHQHHDSDDTSS